MISDEEFLDLKKRVERLEQKLNNPKKEFNKIEKSPNNYNGLVGGIRLLISEKFLNQPKSLGEISEELKRQGYHYSVKSISKALLVDFMKKMKLITRLKENKAWRYVIKK